MVLPLTLLKLKSSSTATTLLSQEMLAHNTATVSQSLLLKALLALTVILSNRRGVLKSQTVDSANSPPSSSSVQTAEQPDSLPHDSFGIKSPHARELTPVVERKNGEMEREGWAMKMRRGLALTKITPVWRYQLAKRLCVKHSHRPYSGATRRSAIFT